MTPRSQMMSDLSVFFNTDEFAQTVTYAGSDIAAIVDYGENLDEAAGSAAARATIYVKQSDVASPAYRDSVVIGSTTWTVRNIREGDDGFTWTLDLQRDERPVL